MSCDSTTSGHSYAYNIPPIEYNSTYTSGISSYKELGKYGSCKSGGIIPPTPVSVVPPIFYDLKPHNYEVKYPKRYVVSYNNAPFAMSNANHITPNNNYTFSVNNPPNFSPYRSIAQTAYTWGGWANEKYPSMKVDDKKVFKPGFNDVAPSNFY